MKFKPSKKHLQIFEKIKSNGLYKPAYSDKEPATMTLINLGLIDWRDDYRGLVLTDAGKDYVKNLSLENKDNTN